MSDTPDWKTGWPPPALMQDDDKRLSRWLANPVSARLQKGGVTITHQTVARLRSTHARARQPTTTEEKT
jgi:hypothetical protein